MHTRLLIVIGRWNNTPEKIVQEKTNFYIVKYKCQQKPSTFDSGLCEMQKQIPQFLRPTLESLQLCNQCHCKLLFVYLRTPSDLSGAIGRYVENMFHLSIDWIRGENSMCFVFNTSPTALNTNDKTLEKGKTNEFIWYLLMNTLIYGGKSALFHRAFSDCLRANC